MKRMSTPPFVQQLPTTPSAQVAPLRPGTGFRRVARGTAADVARYLALLSSLHGDRVAARAFTRAASFLDCDWPLELGEQHIIVTSSDGKRRYTVRQQHTLLRCTCMGGQRGRGCWHASAGEALLFAADPDALADLIASIAIAAAERLAMSDRMGLGQGQARIRRAKELLYANG
jgi:hypothetical protein